MKVLIVCCGILASGFNVQAQEFKDNSIDAIPDAQKAAFLATLLATVSDPFSTQILNFRIKGVDYDQFCGLMNTKNLNGAYTGFKPFLFIASERRLEENGECL